jgi:hypothetical protein
MGTARRVIASRPGTGLWCPGPPFDQRVKTRLGDLPTSRRCRAAPLLAGRRTAVRTWRRRPGRCPAGQITASGYSIHAGQATPAPVACGPKSPLPPPCAQPNDAARKVEENGDDGGYPSTEDSFRLRFPGRLMAWGAASPHDSQTVIRWNPWTGARNAKELAAASWRRVGC